MEVVEKSESVSWKLEYAEGEQPLPSPLLSSSLAGSPAGKRKISPQSPLRWSLVHFTEEQFMVQCGAIQTISYRVSFLLPPPPNLTKSQALYNLNWPPLKLSKYRNL